MLTAHHLYKSYGIQTVLNDISFSIPAGGRIGLIGPNGCGKTSLMRILAGLETPDAGTVIHTRPGLRIGYLAQGMQYAPEQTLQSALSLGAQAPQDPSLELASTAAQLSADPHNPALQARYDALLGQLAAGSGRPQDILAPLGFADIPLSTPISHLSGGQKTRLMLARLLLEDPHLLLLDEPTNHLDVGMLTWLEQWLSSFAGAALIVSHDRVFLDNTVSTILDLKPETHSLRAYPGNYSDYLAQFLREQDKQWAVYRDQEYEIRRMKQDIAHTKEQARHVEITTTPRQPGVRRIAKKVAAKAKSREKKLERYIDSEERVEKPRSAWQIKLEFNSQEEMSRDVLVTGDLSIGYTAGQALLSGLNLEMHAGQRIALTGENGAGKTSLLRTIAGRLPPLAGQVRLGMSVKMGYMTQEQEMLDLSRSPFETIRQVSAFTETEARSFLHYFLFSGDDALRPCGALSFGERTRLELAMLVAGGANFLLLDEPINHLDIPSRSRFEQSLNQFKGTVLAVVHDRYFIEHFATGLWVVEHGRINQY